ncbi:MAG: beta-ribofuranosylaminobenzene 5'-phosphate synthase [Halobacteriota archaeon]|nr:beta-ribofuranosylaminobenzene 5'-phosphate synthase [Halobacteriota archaeon]
MIKIITPSRIHITLIDLNASLGRVDGGVGITLDEPSMVFTAERSDEIVVTGCEELAGRVKQSAEAVIGENDFGIHINIEKIFPLHVGLGSGTQASLASGMAVNGLYNLGLSVREIAELVERGGTSGIGVASFEDGGFILDGGHRFSEKNAFAPSSASAIPPPPVLLRRDFPDWGIVLAIPNLKGSYDAEEVDIFQRECPIRLNGVQAVSHLILMKMLPALFEEDIVEFGRSINEVQKTGFKEREIELQHPIIKTLMDAMIDCGAYGAGMSSFGPVVYALTDSPRKIKEEAQKILNGSVSGETMIVKARNEGAHISYE